MAKTGVKSHCVDSSTTDPCSDSGQCRSLEKILETGLEENPILEGNTFKGTATTDRHNLPGNPVLQNGLLI